MPDASFRAATTGGDTSLLSDTATTTVPAGTQAGDLMVVFLSAGRLSPLGAPTVATPAGWTLRGSSSQFVLAGLYLTKLHCFTRIATASEAATAFQASALSSFGWARLSYSNVDASAPFGQVVFGSGAATTSPVLPGLTTTRARALLVSFLQQGINQAATPPASMTERSDLPAWGLETADQIQAAAGASGTRTFSVPLAADFAYVFAEFWSKLGAAAAVGLAPVGLGAAGALRLAAVAGAALAGASVLGSGSAALQGVLGSGLAALAATGAGVLGLRAAAAVGLEATQASSAARLSSLGQAAVTLAPAGAAGASTLPVAASVQSTFQLAQLSAAAGTGAHGELAQELGGLQAESTVSAPVAGQTDGLLQQLALDASAQAGLGADSQVLLADVLADAAGVLAMAADLQADLARADLAAEAALPCRAELGKALVPVMAQGLGAPQVLARVAANLWAEGWAIMDVQLTGATAVQLNALAAVSRAEGPGLQAELGLPLDDLDMLAAGKLAAVWASIPFNRVAEFAVRHSRMDRQPNRRTR